MKLKYILCSGTITSLLVPVIFFWIPIVGSMVSSLYTVPLGFIGGLLGSTQQFVINQVFFVFPSAMGWLIILPFWFIVGSLCGYGSYKLRVHLYSKQGKMVPSMGISTIIIVVGLQMIIALVLMQLTSPFVEKEKAVAQVKQQQYYDQNCMTVYTQRSHYKVLVCPDTIVGDPAAVEQYFSERKK